MSSLHFLVLFLLTATSVFAASLSGKITDAYSGEPIANATVSLPQLQIELRTNSRGSFLIDGIPTGNFLLEVSCAGFGQYRTEVSFTEPDTKIRKDLELRSAQDSESPLEAPRYRLDEITVATTRASSDYPVTFTNLNTQEVAERSYGQDLPLLFADLPNLNAYSDGGNGIGYSYLRMRGFTQNRVAVQLNGVPLNDAGSHEVFWIDLPDFAEDLQDIQVQRGVGNSLYGPAAFGGTINLVTKTPGIGDRPLIRAEGSYGSWNTRRAMLEFTSGRVQDRYGFAGRLTRMETDGYRNGAWAKLWSYYFSAARFTPSHTTRAVFYGGPEKTHLAYEGIPDSLLNSDRRYNPIQYPGEIDNFFQPHYELHDEWRLSQSTTINNTLYLFRGDGYYDQFRPDADPEQYFFDSRPAPGIDIEILRRRNVGETDIGYIPRAEFEHHNGSLTVGAEGRFHRSHHEGQVIWSNVDYGQGPDYRYYDYRVRKNAYSAFIHELYKPTGRLRLMADLQFQQQTYEFHDDKQWNATVDKSFDALNPRFGANYLVNKPDKTSKIPATSVYGNLSWAQREPAFNDIYDAQDFYSIPYSAPNRFAGGSAGGEYIGPSLKPEKMLNIELGTHLQWSRARFGANVYWMRVNDEIIPYSGQLDDNGVPVSGNADQTLHQGVEFVTAVEPINNLDLSANLALTDHKFVRYQEWDWGVGDFVSRNDNRLASDPPYLANARIGYHPKGIRAALSVRGVGPQFIDNTASEATRVPEYWLVNLETGYRISAQSHSLRAVDIGIRINNLLDKEYEAFGYADYNDGSPRYIVGAPRAVYTTLGVEF